MAARRANVWTAEKRRFVLELVSTTTVKPGQVLAKPVTNANGAVLCPSGLPLTENLIERLRNAGIEHVVIEGGQDKGPTPEERIVALQQRFDGIDDPIMIQIRAAIENRLRYMSLERGPIA